MLDYFNIYLINLDRRPDRLFRVKSRLEQIALPFIRVSAVDGKDPYAPLAKAQYHRYIINQKKRPVQGELACAASHIEAWKLFLKSEAKQALILEDDVTISDDLKFFLEEYSKNPKLDFLNISSKEPYCVDKKDVNAVINDGIFTRPNVFQPKKRRQWRKMEWRRTWRIFKIHLMGSHKIICECDPSPALGSGYIISRRAAESFLKESRNLYFPIDLIWRFSSGNLSQGFLTIPLVSQTNNDTDIDGRFDQGRIPLIYRIARPFLKSRRLKRRLDVIRIYGILRH
ncbi:MAG: glycosyltransferase family 25 protein [Rhizobiales bacterium]|nr:glycosyltransferase family 25 protein [Hyphomicrobiales bacterium]